MQQQSQSTRTEMRPVKYHYADTFWCTYIISVVAASAAELVTYPLDLTKTRLQIQGEAISKAAAISSSSNSKVSDPSKVFQEFVIKIGATSPWHLLTADKT